MCWKCCSSQRLLTPSGHLRHHTINAPNTPDSARRVCVFIVKSHSVNNTNISFLQDKQWIAVTLTARGLFQAVLRIKTVFVIIISASLHIVPFICQVFDLLV